MSLLAFASHIAFCTCLAGLSALTVRAMIFLRVMDRPNQRSMHDRPIPKGGGVGVVAAFLVGVVVLYGSANFARLADPYFRGVIEASLAIALVSFLDDLRDWPFAVKLLAQVGAAAMAIATGIYLQVIRVPYVGAVDLGLFGPLVTLAWILFVTNAMNFIDGLNGLASGVSLVNLNQASGLS